MLIHNIIEGIFSKNDVPNVKLLHKGVRVSFKRGRNLVQRSVRAKMEGKTGIDINKHPIPNIVTSRFPAKNMSCCHTLCGRCQQLANKNTYYSFQFNLCY